MPSAHENRSPYIKIASITSLEVEGASAAPFEVVAFDSSGAMEVFASYPK